MLSRDGKGYGICFGAFFDLNGSDSTLNFVALIYSCKKKNYHKVNIMGYKELLLDSSTSLNPSQPTWSLPSSPYMEMFKVLSVTIPGTFYGTGSQNDKVKFKTGTSTIYTANIPHGQYNITTFPSALAAAMNDALSNGFTATYNDTTKQITIDGNAPFSILSLLSGTTAYRLIGSKKTDASVSSKTFTGNSIDLNGTNSIILTSNSLISRDSTYINAQNSNCLALVPLTSPQNSLTYWVNPGGFLNVASECPYINLQLLDAQTMMSIDLRGASFQVSIGYTDDSDDPVTIS